MSCSINFSVADTALPDHMCQNGGKKKKKTISVDLIQWNKKNVYNQGSMRRYSCAAVTFVILFYFAIHYFNAHIKYPGCIAQYVDIFCESTDSTD